jgi:hypothetical protein
MAQQLALWPSYTMHQACVAPHLRSPPLLLTHPSPLHPLSPTPKATAASQPPTLSSCAITPCHPLLHTPCHHHPSGPGARALHLRAAHRPKRDHPGPAAPPDPLLLRERGPHDRRRGGPCQEGRVPHAPHGPAQRHLAVHPAAGAWRGCWWRIPCCTGKPGWCCRETYRSIKGPASVLGEMHCTHLCAALQASSPCMTVASVR